jgi:hypothetical protein
LVDLATAQLYCVGHAVSARVSGDHVVIDLISEDEEVARPAEFVRRVAELRVRHARKVSSMDRLDRAGL